MEKREAILKEVADIFRKELEDEHLQISFDSSARTVEKWDSITNLMLITAIEEKFNIVFAVEFIFKADNVGDLCDYIMENTSVN